jgi:plastocyanin
MRFALALVAGLLTALLAAGLPASAADSSIAAVGASNWSPATVTIEPGEKVTWSNSTGYAHNVCVSKPGSSPGTCDEFSSGDPADTWPAGGYSHTFAAGSYKFICTLHPNMEGTVTAGSTQTGTSTGTGTGTSTTPPPDTQPTDTITVPTQTQTAPADTSAPAFTGKLKRRASRRSLIVELGASEASTLEATVFRRPPRGRSFARVGQANVKVNAGRNTVTLPRKAAGSVRKGAYRVKLVLMDAAGNRSGTRTLVFKLA